MKYFRFTSSLLCIVLAFALAGCSSSDNIREDFDKVEVADFTAEDLVKLHGATQKKWRLTEVILPEEYRDSPSLPNTACLADDVYTFIAPTSYNERLDVHIELGDQRCFETISDAEHFESSVRYESYQLDGEDLVTTTFYYLQCTIENTIENGVSGTFRRCLGVYDRLVELTEDRAVFSNATYIGDYTWGYVFEAID